MSEARRYRAGSSFFDPAPYKNLAHSDHGKGVTA
jgi:hypothetical protein